MLQNYNGSTLIIDPKGENAAVTLRRQKELEKEVHVLNPWGLHGLPNSNFNPLDILDPNSDNVVDDCDMIAELLVPLDKSLDGNSQHFDSRARALISGLLLHMVTSMPKEDVTLMKLRSLLRLAGDDLDDLLKDMDNNSSEDGLVKESASEIMGLIMNSPKEAGSVFSTAQNATDIFKGTNIRKAVRSSDFDLKDITKGNMTIFVCIPADRLKTHYRWLRLIVGSALVTVQRYHDERVLFILDEFYSLGYMREIDTNMGLLPGFNVTLMPVVQDLNQLHKLYGDSWETFLANSAVKQFLGIKDKFTGEYIERSMGKQTRYTYTIDDQQVVDSWGQPLMALNEILEDEKGIITFINGIPPCYFKKFPYYKSAIAKHADPNPYFKG